MTWTLLGYTGTNVIFLFPRLEQPSLTWELPQMPVNDLQEVLASPALPA